MESLQLLILSYLLLINLSIFQVLLAADTINSLQPLNDGKTLVSSNQTFELGFFSPRNSKNRYLGMWYVKVPDTVVWVANRNDPIMDSSGVLTISDGGNLVILGQSKSIIWSSNASVVAQNPVAQLLDSGNLVLRNNVSTNSESYLWQSFDYPSDTLLAGMKLGWNLKIGLQRYLTSWRTDDDPSPGNFTYKLDISSLPQIITWQGSTKFARIGPWNGAYFIGLPKIPYTVIKSTTIFYEDEIAYTYETVSKSVITLLTLNQSGILQRLVWNDTTGWRSINLGPSDQCDKYGKCGANGKCNTSNEIVCECLKGYVPKSDKEWEAHNWTSGCVRRTPLDCQKPPVFFKLENVKLPNLLKFQVNNSMDQAGCQAECSKNCSCTAYAYSNPSEGGVGCFMWFGDLVDTNSLSDEFRVQDLYIRVSASDIVLNNSSNKRRLRYVLLISFATMLGISVMILLFYIRWKKLQKRGINRNTEEMEGIESNSEEMEVPLFDFHTISTATNNFSPVNVIGEGGFGPVYKGMFLTGQEIAVKRLSSYSRQGVDEFKNEVLLIAKLQHRNLVGLLGCCTKGEEKMLIYEYLPNKSLDHFIFDDHKSCLLSWKKRYDIVLGIARGLLYLHQDSKLQIVHRDLKASNILLDRNLNPKISDFGLARILGDDEHEAKTKRVAGTYGYMSPEYAVDGKFSTKSDVFSMGVLLLEIVSGKRNRGFSCPDHQHNLVGHAWLRWNQGRALELMDTVLGDNCIESQVQRCIHVGLLCVQKLPQDRPTMSSVVYMLEIEGAVLPQPKEPGFFTERGWVTSSSSSEMYTGNSLTISTMDAR